MGGCCSVLGPARDTIHLIFIGLDGAGKTSVLNMVHQKPDPPPDDGIPDAITFQYDDFVNFRVFDLRGQDRSRALWPMFLADAHGIVFVVDAANLQRFQEAAEVLHNVMKNPCASGKYLLIIANKQDLPGACSEEEITLHLSLDQLPANSWHVSTCTSIAPADEEATSEVTRDMAIMGAMVPDLVLSKKVPRLDPQAQQGLDWLVDAILDGWEALEATLAVQRLQNPFAELVPAEAVPDWRRESMFSRVASAASLGRVSWGAVSGRRLSSASFSSRGSSQRRRSESRTTRDASPSRLARRARKSASIAGSIAGSSRRGSEASQVSKASKSSRVNSVRFKGARSTSSSSGSSPSPKVAKETPRRTKSEQVYSASEHPMGPIHAIEELHGTCLSEEEAIAAVKRLWQQLGLLWPEDVEENSVHAFDHKPGRKSARASFAAFASGVVASSSLASSGAARTSKVWTGWAGAKTKGMGLSMRHKISKFRGLGLFKHSLSSSDDNFGESERKAIEYDSIREVSREVSQASDCGSADHSSLYDELLSQQNQTVQQKMGPESVVHAWLAQPGLSRADSARKVHDESIAGSDHDEDRNDGTGASAQEQILQHRASDERVQVLLKLDEEGRVNVLMTVNSVSLGPTYSSWNGWIRVTLQVTTDSALEGDCMLDSCQQQFVQLQLHLCEGNEDVSEDEVESFSEGTVSTALEDESASIEFWGAENPAPGNLVWISALELQERVDGTDESSKIIAAPLGRRSVHFDSATKQP